jgi:alpha-galactosidase
MAIMKMPDRRLFHLRGKTMSWVMQVGADELMHHVYWGPALDEIPPFLYDRAPYRRRELVEDQPADSPKCTREFAHYECPTYGTSDFRLPALEITDGKTGSALLDLRYAGAEITPGAVPVAGMPFARSGADSQTLTVTLRDPLCGLTVQLHDHLIPDLDVVARHMTLRNEGDRVITVNSVMSGTVDFEDGNLRLMTFGGTTLREFTPDVQELHPGVTQVDSSRGSSSHQHSPNAVLLRPGADAVQGECYALSLMYGGSFVLRAEKDAYGSCRVQGGINPLAFAGSCILGRASTRRRCS